MTPDFKVKKAVDDPRPSERPSQREAVYKELSEQYRHPVDQAIVYRDSVVKELDRAESKIDESLRDANKRKHQS